PKRFPSRSPAIRTIRPSRAIAPSTTSRTCHCTARSSSTAKVWCVGRTSATTRLSTSSFCSKNRNGCSRGKAIAEVGAATEAQRMAMTRPISLLCQGIRGVVALAAVLAGVEFLGTVAWAADLDAAARGYRRMRTEPYAPPDLTVDEFDRL